MKKCPFCAELIQDEAIVCRFCGRDIPRQAPASATASPSATTRLPSIPKRAVQFAGLFTGLAFLSFLINYLRGSMPGPEFIGSLMYSLPVGFVAFFVLGLPLAWAERDLLKRVSRRTLLIGCTIAALGAFATIAVAAMLYPAARPQVSGDVAPLSQGTDPCACASISEMSEILPRYVNQRVCLTGRAWNVNYSGPSWSGPYFVLRGQTVFDSVTVFPGGFMPRAIKEDDPVAVVGTYVGSNRVELNSSQQIWLCR